MSGNNEFGVEPRDVIEGDIENPTPQVPRNPFEFLMPPLPEVVGEVNVDDKAREVLLGLDKKILRELSKAIASPDRKPPDLNALWNEALGLMSSLSRFVRDRNGKYYDDGIHYEEFLSQAEFVFDALEKWGGILKTLGHALDLGGLLIGSLFYDVRDLLDRGDLKFKIPEDVIMRFRYEYESKNLESMKNAFAEPTTANVEGTTEGRV